MLLKASGLVAAGVNPPGGESEKQKIPGAAEIASPWGELPARSHAPQGSALQPRTSKHMPTHLLITDMQRQGPMSEKLYF